MSTWSFTQCWGPGLVLEAGEPKRPVLRLLVDEEGGHPVAFEAGTAKLAPTELAAWLQARVLLGHPQTVLLDDPALAEAISRVAPDVWVEMQAYPPVLRRGLDLIRARFPEPVPVSLLELLGPDAMRLFLRQSEALAAARPWLHINPHTILQFSAPDHVYGVTLPEAHSVAVFANLAQALSGNELPIAALGPMRPCYVHWDDLNFSDTLGLRRMRDSYPGITLEADWIGSRVAHDLLWLLQALPSVTRSGVAVDADGYGLQFTGLQARNQAWRRALRRGRAA